MDKFNEVSFQQERFMQAITSFVPDDKKRIVAAFELAKKAHKGQKRDEGPDYIIHPLRIVNTLFFELKIKDAGLMVVGLLHDVVEDSPVTIDEIGQAFGKRIATLIQALTRDKEKETKLEKFKKTLNADKEVRLMKSIDWLDNLRSFPFRTDRGERFFRHIREAYELYVPLAESTDPYITQEMKNVLSKLPKPKQPTET